MKTVVIYSTPTCTYCHLAKDFFKKHDIEYTEHNVAENTEKRNEMIEKSGQMGVPVIFVDNDMTIGFDEKRIRELLEK